MLCYVVTTSVSPRVLSSVYVLQRGFLFVTDSTHKKALVFHIPACMATAAFHDNHVTTAGAVHSSPQANKLIEYDDADDSMI
jgi:hypothetical protein